MKEEHIRGQIRWTLALKLHSCASSLQDRGMAVSVSPSTL